MKRLLSREIKRYGEELNTNERIIKKSKAFLKWAEKYDDETNDEHSISQHKNWIEVMDCQVIEINGGLSNYERQKVILEKIRNH